MLPVPKGSPVTLGYRQKPRNPKLKNYIHRGIDFGVRTGTRVVAPIGGKVVHAGWGGMGKAFGIHVVVYVNGVYYIVAHLSAAKVKRGQWVTMGQLLGLSGATGNVRGAHVHYGEFTRYSYTADRKPRFLDAAAGVPVVTAVQNLAGNNAHGIKTGPARARMYAKKRKTIPVDVLLALETTVASGIRGALDAGLKGLMQRAGGGEGRYAYLRTKGLTKIAGGMIVAAKTTWYRKDDKQGAYVIYEKNGARGMDVGVHLESDLGDEADRKRVAQFASIVTQAYAIAAKYGVQRRNILIAGDLNSNRLVVDSATKLGLVNAAAGTKYEDTPTFIQWDGNGTDRYDYALRHKDGDAEVVSIADNQLVSDHAGLRVERTIAA